MVILFLDDCDDRIQRIRNSDTIVYVRTPAQFRLYLRNHARPDCISFDHDLGSSLDLRRRIEQLEYEKRFIANDPIESLDYDALICQLKQEYLSEEAKREALGDCYIPETGMDLVNWTIENNFQPQVAIIHTHNTVKVPNMESALREAGVTTIVAPFDPKRILFDNPAQRAKEIADKVRDEDSHYR